MIYLQLFYTFFKIGLFGFGGGYAMLSMIQGEVVTRYGWVSSQEFTDIVAISQMTPGPIGINAATYVGFTSTGSVWGSIIASFAVVLPSWITPGSSRITRLRRVGINERRKLRFAYGRYLFIRYQYHYLSDCIHRNKKI